MSIYTPVPDKIVNGNLADANDIADELNSIAQGFTTVENVIQTNKDETIASSKAYTDEELKTISVDGGTY